MLPLPDLRGLIPGADPSEALGSLKEYGVGQGMVVGICKSVALVLGKTVEGLRPFPSMVGPGVDIPATPAALWIWLRGEDPGKLVQVANELKRILSPAFRLDEVIDGFKHDESPEGLGRDLSGYEDGTENPEEEDAPEAAHVKRTAQEDFEPEAQLTRMSGLEDGIVDALFRFSRPVTGAYFWCPPVKDGKLNLSAIGI